MTLFAAGIIIGAILATSAVVICLAVAITRALSR